MRLSQSYSGRSEYHTELDVGRHRLIVAVECHVGDFPVPVFALLENGSYWCVLNAEIAKALGFSAEPGDAIYLTRFGRLAGTLHRIPLYVAARDGATLEVEATWFVSEEWDGPTVIGWKGCLERIRFALDPTHDHFYFAAGD